KIVWDHPENADLKKLRKNPNILFPGDQVFIPDKEEKEESGPTDKRHSFVVDKEKLKLVLVLEDFLEKPIAGAQCALLVDGQTFQLTTDGKGKIEQEIPLDAKEATLTIRGDQTPFANDVIPLKIGHLDPLDEISGQVARLNNLGYFAGPLDGSDTEAFESAIEEFQCDHSLKVDGICGPKTQDKLKEVYGC
ncbi:MAG TPA: peptidoglycan-binding domain-containing protein, partial [Candidatus Acidoferrum sp.]